jgi:hypothetical protein
MLLELYQKFSLYILSKKLKQDLNVKTAQDVTPGLLTEKFALSLQRD